MVKGEPWVQEYISLTDLAESRHLMKTLILTLLGIVAPLAAVEEVAQDATVEMPRPEQTDKQTLEHLLTSIHNEAMVLRSLLNVQTGESDPIFRGRELNKSEYLRGYREQATMGELSPQEARKVRGKLKFLHMKTGSDERKKMWKDDLVALHCAFSGVIKLPQGISCETYISPNQSENGRADRADFFHMRQPAATIYDLNSLLTYNSRRPDVLQGFPDLYTEIDKVLPLMPEGAAWRILVPLELLGERMQRLYSIEQPKVMEFTLWRSSISRETKEAALEQFSQHEYKYKPDMEGRPDLEEQASYMTGCADYIDAYRETRNLWNMDHVLQLLEKRWADAVSIPSREEICSRLMILSMRRAALLDMLHEIDPQAYPTDEEMKKRYEVKPIILKLK